MLRLIRKFERQIAAFLYLKLCINRAKGHIGIILGLVNEIGIIVVILKLYDMDNFIVIGAGVWIHKCEVVR